MESAGASAKRHDRSRPLRKRTIHSANGGDYTVHIVVGLDPEGRMYVLDLWRQQAASDRWVEWFCDLVIDWRPLGWAEERGQIKAGVGPYLDRRQRERKAYCAREAFPTRGDKAVRAQSIRGRMALVISPVNLLVPIVSAASLGFLALLGAIGGHAGGANVLRATARVTFWGAFAMALTAGIGKLFGTVV